MALTRRTGGNSFLILGRQTAYGTPITDFSTAGSNPVQGELIRKRFPFTRLTLDADGEQVQSESIIGAGSDTLNASGQLFGAGQLECEILPEDILHFIRGILNPDDSGITKALEAPHAGLSAAVVPITGLTFTSSQQPNVPSQVKVTFVGTLATLKTLEITGFRRIGRPSGEKFRVSQRIAIDLATELEYQSTKFFNELTSVKVLDTSGDPIASGSVTARVDYEPETPTTEMNLSTTNAQFPGWTFQMSKGGMPVVAKDVIPNTMQITIGANIRVLMDLLASEVTNNRMIDTGQEPEYKYDETHDANDAALSRFPTSDLRFYPSWGGALFIGDEAGTTINANTGRPLAFTDLKSNQGNWALVVDKFISVVGVSGS